MEELFKNDNSSSDSLDFSNPYSMRDASFTSSEWHNGPCLNMATS